MRWIIVLGIPRLRILIRRLRILAWLLRILIRLLLVGAWMRRIGIRLLRIGGWLLRKSPGLMVGRGSRRVSGWLHLLRCNRLLWLVIPYLGCVIRRERFWRRSLCHGLRFDL